MKCGCILSPWWVVKVLAGLSLVAQLGLDVWWNWGTLFESSQWAAQLTVGLGFVLVCWHYVLLKGSTRDISRPQSLVTQGGLYGLVRHPMYLGDLVVILGLGLMVPTVFSVLVVGLSWVALLRLSRFEDNLMAHRFPDQFEAYSQSTRRVIPFLH